MPAAPAAFARWRRGRGPAPAWWTIPVGIALIAAVWAGWTALLIGAAMLVTMVGGAEPLSAVARLQIALVPGAPGTLAFALASYAGLWPGAWLAMRLLHGVDGARLLGPRRRPEMRPFLIGAALGAGAYALAMLPALALVGQPEATPLDRGVWAFWLLPLALLILVQSGGEEVVFRGWMTWALARMTPSPLVWAVLPAAAFGALHYAPGMPGLTPLLYVATTLCFGLTAAALVWRTGGLSAPMGLHAGFNLPALTLVGLEGVVPGGRLWSYPGTLAEPLIAADFAASLALLALVLSRVCPVGR